MTRKSTLSVQFTIVYIPKQYQQQQRLHGLKIMSRVLISLPKIQVSKEIMANTWKVSFHINHSKCFSTVSSRDCKQSIANFKELTISKQEHCNKQKSRFLLTDSLNDLYVPLSQHHILWHPKLKKAFNKWLMDLKVINIKKVKRFRSELAKISV